MISFGAVIVETSLSKTFYTQLKPASAQWIPVALQVSGFTREETLEFEDSQTVMEKLSAWIEAESSIDIYLLPNVECRVSCLNPTYLSNNKYHFHPS
jgi:hypothetical protein